MEAKLEKKKFLGSVVNKTPNGDQSKAFHEHGGHDNEYFSDILRQ